MQNRRTALAMLGLVPASAIGAESFIEPPEVPGEMQSVTGAYRKERWARAFELLAAEIRKESVELSNAKISASLGPNDVADLHELTVTFRYLPELS